MSSGKLPRIRHKRESLFSKYRTPVESNVYWFDANIMQLFSLFHLFGRFPKAVAQRVSTCVNISGSCLERASKRKDFRFALRLLPFRQVPQEVHLSWLWGLPSKMEFTCTGAPVAISWLLVSVASENAYSAVHHRGISRTSRSRCICHTRHKIYRVNGHALVPGFQRAHIYASFTSCETEGLL